VIPSRSQDREKLISDRGLQGRIRRLKTLCRDHPCRDLVYGDKTRCIAENIHTEPRQLIAREVAGPLGIGPLRLDCLGIAVGLEQSEHAVDMRQVRALLVELAFQAGNSPGDLGALLA
jgi:hypothetical protein